MRSAMIAVSVMLAIFLVWPLVFGGGHAPVDAAPAQARAPLVNANVSDIRLLQASAPPVRYASARKPESCYHRYQREIASCSVNSAACRLSVADRWDLCEATGFWPQ